MIGTHLGHYRLTALLGEGGMGRVFAAEDLRLGRRIALKLLPEALRHEREHVERFQREARVLAALNHPNVVTVHSVEEADGHAFITMELVEGETLLQRIRPGGLPLQELLAIALPLAEALAAAHGHGIVHRDLKPANVMLGRDGRLKVVDFGIAKPEPRRTAGQAALTGAGLVLGTPAYMAPEQLQGATVDQRADLFAFGVVLYELATGARPFGGGSDADVVSAILRDPPPALRRQRGDLPEQLEGLVAACLEKDPARRVDAAATIVRALESLRRQDAPPGVLEAAPTIAALAVLPLQELGAASDDLLADGLTEALISDLARASGLKVISRSSAMRFRGSDAPLQEIAQRLGVDALVMGTVRRSGTHIRVSVELIEPASERVLWADRYERELQDVLRLQDEMARAIADGVHARVSQGSAARTAPRRVDPEVYLLDLKGRSQIELRTAASFRAALSHLHKAIELDPSYGPSWLGVARVRNMQVNYGLVAPGQVRDETETALARARELGAVPAEILCEHAHMRWQMDFDWAGAEDEFRRGLDLAPTSARLWYWRGIALATAGECGAGLDCIDRAASLDPLSDFIRAARGMVLYFADRLPESIACLRQVIELAPDLAPPYWLLGMALSAAGQFEEAAALGEEAVARLSRIPRALAYLGHACARAGRTTDAERLLAELQGADGTYVPAYFPAMVLLGLGRRDAALDELERARREGDSMLRDVRVDRVWDGLRAEPRFVALLDSMRAPVAGNSGPTRLQTPV